MTLQEKVAQLVGLWAGAYAGEDEAARVDGDPPDAAVARDAAVPPDATVARDTAGAPAPAPAPADATGASGRSDAGGSVDVAPHQSDLSRDPLDFDDAIRHGLGQLTRPFGTRPIDATTGARALAAAQRRIADANPYGLPALVHEECLTGFAAYGATIYPTPLAWGASFDPELVRAMAERIGSDMRSVGVHQGLAPVLDVTRDYRWGRTEETIGEDPYLVATIGTAYVRGLQAGGVDATAKHFAGYSASRAGRNLAPVSMGPRELADVVLPPFELAVVEGGIRSVMNSYAEIDGVPVAADADLLTGLLRDAWGFDGTVVADYFSVAFLRRLHRTAATDGEAAVQALRAGIDVELPDPHCYPWLVAEVEAGRLSEAYVDRAIRRVLLRKCAHGLLDPRADVEPPASVDLDRPENRAIARRLAEESIVLVANDGTLPLDPAADRSVAVVGPRARDPHAMLGCYTFPMHVGHRYPDRGDGVRIASLADALTERLGADRVRLAAGCDVDSDDRSGFAEAVAAARACDVAVVAVGDRAGLFGRGTSGEGCDVPDLALPGRQAELVDAVLATGTPVVLVLLTGRPYALGRFAGRVAAIVQAYFPGQEGGSALADVLTGAVNPSGRLPVELPRFAGGQPSTYLHPPLGGHGAVSSVDPTALYPFGHGLAYTSFEWTDACLLLAAGAGVDARLATDGRVRVRVRVRNAGERAGTEVVQLYLGQRSSRVTRPVTRLVGYRRVDVPAGASRTVEFDVHADLTAYADRDGCKVVEPGPIELRLAASSTDVRATLRLELTGPARSVDHTRVLRCPTRVLA